MTKRISKNLKYTNDDQFQNKIVRRIRTAAKERRKKKKPKRFFTLVNASGRGFTRFGTDDDRRVVKFFYKLTNKKTRKK